MSDPLGPQRAEANRKLRGTIHDPTARGREEDFIRGLKFIGVGTAIIFFLFLIGICNAPSNRYTKEDCIQQWHDVGVYASAEEYCADYR